MLARHIWHIAVEALENQQWLSVSDMTISMVEAQQCGSKQSNYLVREWNCVCR